MQTLRAGGLALAAAVALALVFASSAAAFVPPNPLYPQQWYLAQDHAFDAWPSGPPQLQPVKVAVVDSGVDCSLPELQSQIVAEKSFVGGDPCQDMQGHGTIVAGEIGAALGSTGIVGLAWNAQLLVAKVVAADGTIPVRAEARAIRWAADQGARVINLSFAAVRDPKDPSLDTYSRVEASAVAYAIRSGAVVVAAAGNSNEAYASPWPYAGWPAALPHVIGVAALTRSGSVPTFSDRDRRFVDMSAPGVDIFSTFPANLTSQQSGCALQGYTGCASGEYEHPQGTSFAAPQVSAAAAVLLGLDPNLTNSQVSEILEHSADDVNPSDGCAFCLGGRDRFSGWGRLDVAKAVAVVESGKLPPPDRLEPNDTIAEAPPLWGRRQFLIATLDYWDDPVDIYKIRLARGQRVSIGAHAFWPHARIRLLLFDRDGKPLAQAPHAGPRERLRYQSHRTGWYFVELRAALHGHGAYRLHLKKSP